MSIAARQQLVDPNRSPGRLVFQRDTESSDLLDPSVTQTELIALLLELTAKGWNIEITSCVTDHLDDSDLGLNTHSHGYCVDCWPLASRTPGDYLDQGDPRMQAFLHDAASSPWLYQIGLGGCAQTPADYAAAGKTVFTDNGADHVHIGANGR